MFEHETSGFIEAFDPNAEPGELPASEGEAAPAEGEAEAEA
jgi:large subunit ribosomal protein L9